MALTRRVKQGGPTWTVKEKRGRRVISLGVWAPAVRIASIKTALELERQDPAYEKRLQAGRRRRAEQQAQYTVEFYETVFRFLAFAPCYRELGEQVARAIAAHATPVGSGTVARTQRIPVAQRAEAATLAWLRHQTTAYDHMHIARVKGLRREVRRSLAEQSRTLLNRYRRGEPIPAAQCLLRRALETPTPTPTPTRAESDEAKPG